MKTANCHIYNSLLILIFCFCAGKGLYAKAMVVDELQPSPLVVITDKRLYFPGEIMWFKVRSANGTSTLATDNPRIIYVELVGREGAVTLQAKVDAGQVPIEGSFYVPTEVESGRYHLVGYYSRTDEHETPDYLFHKEIEIVNPYTDGSTLKPTDRVEGAHMSPYTWDSQSLDIQLSFNHAKVQKRQNIEFEVKSYLNGAMVEADLSVSVYAINEFQHVFDPAACSESYIAYNAQDNLSAYERVFDQVKISYLNKESGLPITGEKVFLTIIGTYPKLYVSTTDSQGVATFFVKPFYGDVDMATQVADGRLSDVRVLSPFVAKHNLPPVETNSQKLPRNGVVTEEALNAHLVNVQLENLFYSEERSVFHEDATDRFPFYGMADKIYLLDDYTRFVLMEEVLREYVSEVSLRRNRGDYYFRVLDDVRNAYQSGQPLITIDGVPFGSVNDIIDYDPLKVERIEITTSKFVFGKTIYEGLVNFYTYKGDIDGFPLPQSVTIFNYEGLQKRRVFFQPEYETAEQRNTRTPDRRNVLKWSASLGADTSNTFTTSDVSGEYVIVVEGIDKDGNKGSMVKYFIVE